MSSYTLSKVVTVPSIETQKERNEAIILLREVSLKVEDTELRKKIEEFLEKFRGRVK